MEEARGELGKSPDATVSRNMQTDTCPSASTPSYLEPEYFEPDDDKALPICPTWTDGTTISILPTWQDLSIKDLQIQERNKEASPILGNPKTWNF